MKDDGSAAVRLSPPPLWSWASTSGRLERAFQLDAPFTVSGSFLQRMGRTGRRGRAARRCGSSCGRSTPEPRAMLPATIPVDGCCRASRWCSCTSRGALGGAAAHWTACPSACCTTRPCARLASCGELTRPRELAQPGAATLSCFHRVSQEDYRVLLRHLLETGQIQPHGDRRAGGRAWQGSGIVTNSFKFYAVFQENVEYSVRGRAREELGTIVMPPPVGE